MIIFSTKVNKILLKIKFIYQKYFLEKKCSCNFTIVKNNGCFVNK